MAPPDLLLAPLYLSNAQNRPMSSQILPLELIDKAIGSKIWVIMKTGELYSSQAGSDGG